ncbi:hypothetical protein PT974_03355 [Cladobotryum mycophilum]|uniref:Uncharacterized protein n=1 Tax=Cladobotryum mycophilum TaxID=491253 RepID=A0ABR0ST58_9HYPO
MLGKGGPQVLDIRLRSQEKQLMGGLLLIESERIRRTLRDISMGALSKLIPVLEAKAVDMGSYGPRLQSPGTRALLGLR